MLQRGGQGSAPLSTTFRSLTPAPPPFSGMEFDAGGFEGLAGPAVVPDAARITNTRDHRWLVEDAALIIAKTTVRATNIAIRTTPARAIACASFCMAGSTTPNHPPAFDITYGIMLPAPVDERQSLRHSSE